MPIVVPEEGAEALLGYLLNPGSNTFPNSTLKLFVNDYTPNWNTLQSAFVEASFPGYSQQPVTPNNWSIGPGTDTNMQGTFPTEFSWTSGAGTGVVYGYWVTPSGFSRVLWCERFATPIVLETGLVLRLRPRLALWSHYLPPTP